MPDPTSVEQVALRGFVRRFVEACRGGLLREQEEPDRRIVALYAEASRLLGADQPERAQLTIGNSCPCKGCGKVEDLSLYQDTLLWECSCGWVGKVRWR